MKNSRGSHRSGSSKSNNLAKSYRHKEEEIAVLRPVNDRFKKAKDYHRHWLADRSLHYDEQATKRVPRCMSRLQVHMKSQRFDFMDPIPEIGFLHTFKMACDTNEVHELAAIGLIPNL